MSANAEIIAELRRVLNERDEAREQLDLTKRELGRWVDRETKAVRERDEAIKARDQYLRERDQARMAEKRARESLDELDGVIYDCLPSDYDDDSPLDCVEHAGDQLQALAQERDEWRDKFHALNQTTGELCDACGWAFKIPGEPCRCEVVRERDEARAEVERVKAERDEALSKYEVLHDEADRALRAPLLALSAIVGGDVNFAPGPWDSQTRGMNALAERITRSFAIWRDRAAKQSTEAYRRGAEAMREACARWIPYILHTDCNPEEKMRALPIPEEP